jgi:hypothetical protein
LVTTWTKQHSYSLSIYLLQHKCKMQENWCFYWQDWLKLGDLWLITKYLRKRLILINISGDCPICKIIIPLNVYCCTSLKLEMVIVTEMLQNFNFAIHYRINFMFDRVCFSNYCFFAYLHKLSSVSTSMWWSWSSKEWIYFCLPLSMEVSVVCITWFVVVYCQDWMVANWSSLETCLQSWANVRTD